MSLLFRYRRVPLLRPAVALGGATFRPRPLVRVTLIAQSSTALTDGLLDTGADDTVFPDSVALRLGIDLTNAPTGEATGSSSTSAIRYAQLTLRLTDGREFCEWLAWVGFTSAPLRQPLLGFAGCLQFFHSDFRGDREEVELVTNSRYAGRVWQASPRRSAALYPRASHPIIHSRSSPVPRQGQSPSVQVIRSSHRGNRWPSVVVVNSD